MNAMTVNEYVPGTGIIRVDNTYSTEELGRVWYELELIRPSMRGPEQTGAARTPDGKVIKENRGIFLNQIYRKTDDMMSPIYRKATDLIRPEFAEFYQSLNPVHVAYEGVNVVMPLVNYYGDGDYYDWHKDHCLYTALTYLFKMPREFSGGDTIIRIGNTEHALEVDNNVTYIFPGGYWHSVTPVVMAPDRAEVGRGRYAISTFMNFVPDAVAHHVEEHNG